MYSASVSVPDGVNYAFGSPTRNLRLRSMRLASSDWPGRDAGIYLPAYIYASLSSGTAQNAAVPHDPASPPATADLYRSPGISGTVSPWWNTFSYWAGDAREVLLPGAEAAFMPAGSYFVVLPDVAAPYDISVRWTE